MTSYSIKKAGEFFMRPGGWEGRWNRDPSTKDPDDHVICPFDFVSVPGDVAEHVRDDLQRLRPDRTALLLGSPHKAGILIERLQMQAQSPADYLEAD